MGDLEQYYYAPRKPYSFGGARGLIKSSKARTNEDRERVRDWLSGQDAYTLYKPAKSKFLRRPTIVSGVGVQMQADLMDVHSHNKGNDGVNFLLVVVDAFSRKLFVTPLKSKSATSVEEGMRAILEEVGSDSYLHMQTDKGKEFLNAKVQALLRDKGIKHFTSEDASIKASLVERVNRTLRLKIHRYLEWIDGDRYIDVLPALVHSYNSTTHTALGVAPNEVNYDNQEDIWHRLYEGDGKFGTSTKPKLSPGDLVRISKARETIEKRGKENWKRELFRVETVLDWERPVVYRLTDLAGEKILGTFYEAELQKVKAPETYKIEKVLRTRGKGSRKQYLVKWMGYPESFNSWVNQEDMA